MSEIDVYTRDTVPKGLRHTLALYHDEVCRKQVNRAYTMGQIRNSKIDLYIVCTREVGRGTRSGAKRVELLGFLIAQKRKHAMYLDVVCARRGFGGPLIERFEQEAVRAGYGAAELKAIPAAESFWKKKGFRRLPPTKACKTGVRQKRVGTAEDGFRMSKCLRSVAIEE